MTALRQPTDAAALAKRVRDSIAQPYLIEGHQIVVDISIGISIAPIDAIEPDQLLKNADMALYGAKADGRGTFRFFEAEMDARMQARRKNRNVVRMVKSALEDSGMAGNRLQLEITESVLMQNTFATLATLHELRKLGIQIAMDDFGTGYSSLSYLRSFPFDKIKIDRSFIDDLSNGAEPLAIVNAVAGLAKCLNTVSTAEGVETQQQLEQLQSIGCTEMQGYLFSRARPASEIEELFLPQCGKAGNMVEARPHEGAAAAGVA
jgi:predicted signal transduction protein with EAL and GGDEF domain